MIFITAKFRILPEDADRWPEIAGEFTRATRAEPGQQRGRRRSPSCHACRC